MTVSIRKTAGILPRLAALAAPGLLLAASVAATDQLAPASGDTAVVVWNDALLQAVRATIPGPTIVARALAVLHTCIFDAWAA